MSIDRDVLKWANWHGCALPAASALNETRGSIATLWAWLQEEANNEETDVIDLLESLDLCEGDWDRFAEFVGYAVMRQLEQRRKKFAHIWKEDRSWYEGILTGYWNDSPVVVSDCGVAFPAPGQGLRLNGDGGPYWACYDDESGRWHYRRSRRSVAAISLAQNE